MPHDAIAKERGHAMKSAIDELVGHHEVGGLVLFLERADGGDGEDPLGAEFFERIDVGAEIQFGGQDAVAAAVTGEEGDFAAFQFTEDERVRGVAKRGFDALFMDVGEAGHGVKPTAADNANFCLRQCRSDQRTVYGRPVCVIQQTSQYKGRKRV